MTAPWFAVPHAYSGVGSRETPPDILDLMERVASALALRGWALRTGGASGADSAFERGALRAGGLVGLYLPWCGFEGRTEHVVLHEPTAQALAMAPQYHPAWGSLRRGGRALHARNVHQVLGSTCDNPASFVLCWTRDGVTTAAETSSRTGGTGTAIRIASAWNVPVWNLRRDDHRAMWTRLLDITMSIAMFRAQSMSTCREAAK